MNLFAYGTLQFPEVVSAITHQAFEWEEAVLSGFKCRTLQGQLFPAIIRDPKSTAQGRVLFDLPDEVIKEIDVFEEDFYQREEVTVITSNRGELNAHAFVLRPEFLDLFSTF